MAVTSEQTRAPEAISGSAQRPSRLSTILAFASGFSAAADFQLPPGTVSSPPLADLLLAATFPLAAAAFVLARHRAAAWLAAILIACAALGAAYYASSLGDGSHAATTVRVFLAIAAAPLLARELLRSGRVGVSWLRSCWEERSTSPSPLANGRAASSSSA